MLACVTMWQGNQAGVEQANDLLAIFDHESPEVRHLLQVTDIVATHLHVHSKPFRIA